MAGICTDTGILSQTTQGCRFHALKNLKTMCSPTLCVFARLSKLENLSITIIFAPFRDTFSQLSFSDCVCLVRTYWTDVSNIIVHQVQL